MKIGAVLCRTKEKAAIGISASRFGLPERLDQGRQPCGLGWDRRGVRHFSADFVYRPLARQPPPGLFGTWDLPSLFRPELWRILSRASLCRCFRWGVPGVV